MAPRKGFVVDFEPSGVRLLCDEPLTAMQAAARAGLLLRSECGGRGTCGKCRVKATRGGAAAPRAADLAAYSEAQFEEGWRLACQTVLSAPCTLSVPREAMQGGHVLQTEGGVGPWEAKPPVEAVSLTFSPPSLSDQVSDFRRIERLLKEKRPGHDLSIGLPALRTLRLALRDGDGPLWVALRAGELVTARRGSKLPLLGLAVDVGTTKLAFYLIDLERGLTVATKGVANPQIPEGEDVMSRLDAALSRGRASSLQQQVIEKINSTAQELCSAQGFSPEDIVELCLVGNTAMHHLLLGLPVGPLAVAPFIPAISRAIDVRADALGLKCAPGAVVHAPAVIAGFVGSDHLAFLLSCGFGMDDSVMLGIDVGTNTEIALQAGGRIVSCSTASGPAFEGAEIRQGMRAEPGAIDRVSIDASGAVSCTVIGGGEAAGICGSGILDALSQMRAADIVNQRGRLREDCAGVTRGGDGRPEYRLATNGSGSVALNQQDIDQVLLAKGAIRAGIEILLQKLGVTASDVSRVLLAGAFGSSLDPLSAMRIGMFPPVPPQSVSAVGNAAGAGARMMLASTDARERAARLAERIEHVELAIFPGFHAHFARGIGLPR